MKNLLLITLLTLTTFLSVQAWSDEGADLDHDTQVSDIEKPNWRSAIQTKYSYSDEQMKAFSDAGVNYPSIVKASEIAKSSGKTVDEVLKMRTEQKMGWGKIAKDLGVKPGEIGKSIAALRHDVQEKRKEKHEAREEKKEEWKAKKVERKAEFEKRRAERVEKRGKK